MDVVVLSISSFSYKISTFNRLRVSTFRKMRLSVAFLVVTLAALGRSDYTDPQWRAGAFLKRLLTILVKV